MREKQLGKFLSLVLRHKPETVGIALDEHGWANVDELLQGIRGSGREIDMALLKHIVRENDKQRFSFSEDGRKIRANQGHSVAVDVELEQRPPPEILYHGTVERNIHSIETEGLLRGNRLYVHLSPDTATANKVAARRKGMPVIYEVLAGRMCRDGYVFYRSINGVWLTEHVPSEYLHRLGTIFMGCQKGK